MAGPNFPYTNLDFQQVIKQAFDEANDRLRVDASFSGTVSVSLDPANDGVYIGDGVDVLNINSDGSINVNITNPIQVEIDAADGDNIAISDGTDTLQINSDGSINTVQAPANLKWTYNEITAVPSGIETTVISYTALTNTKIMKIDVSGNNIALYKVKINGNDVNIRRTYFGSELNTLFDFDSGIDLPASQSVVVSVIHNRPTVGNFNGNILYNEV